MNKEVAQTFLSALAGNENLTYKMIADKAADDGRRNALPPEYTDFETAWKMIEYGNKKGFGAFFVPNHAGKKSTADADIEYARAVWIDIDSGEFPSFFPIEPSFILNRSDNGGSHVYWLLSSPETDLQKWTIAQKQLIHFYGSDKSIHNPARLMRIPGTWNNKRDKKTQYEIHTQNDNKYRIEDIILAHTDKENIKKQAFQKIKKLFPTGPISDGEGRHKKMLSVVFTLNDFGLAKNDVMETVKNVNEKYFSDPYTEAELTKFIEAKKYAQGESGAKAVENELREVERRERVREAMNDWYYVRNVEKFYDIHTIDRSVSLTGFNARFSHIAGINNVAGYAFKNDLLKQAEYFEYTPGALPVQNVRGGVSLNMWRAPEVEREDKKPDWFLDHIQYLIPEKTEREHFLNYFAYLVQNPGAKIMHACLLVGKQGTGKSLIQRLLSKVFGSSNVCTPHNENLSGGFTGWAKHCQIVFINELSQIDKKDFNNKIKPFITENEIEIREMYTPPYVIKNHLNIIAVSNHENPLFIDPDDRRWFVMKSTAEQRSIKYYTELIDNIDNHAGQVLAYLQDRDVSKFNPGERPVLTQAKIDIIQDSKSDLEIYIENAIECKEAGYENDFITVQDIRESLPNALRNSHYTTSNRIGRILTHYGAERVKSPITIEGKGERYWIIRNIDNYRGLNDAQLAAKIKDLAAGIVEKNAGFNVN